MARKSGSNRKETNTTTNEAAELDAELRILAAELARTADGSLSAPEVSLDDPLDTRRQGLDVFDGDVDEMSTGLDTGTGFDTGTSFGHNANDRFGDTWGTNNDGATNLGDQPAADDDAGPPALPPQATGDPSTMLDDDTDEAEEPNSSQPEDPPAEEPNSSQPEDAPTEPNSSQPEDAPPAEPNSTPDQLESTPKPSDSGDVRQVVGRLASGLGLDPADEDDDDGRDGTGPRGYETGEILPVATLRTSDNHGDYVNPGTGDIDIDFDQASQDLARAFGANGDIYGNPGWGDSSQGGALQPEEAIQPGAVDPEDDDGME
jgi:hypothetical protein